MEIFSDKLKQITKEVVEGGGVTVYDLSSNIYIKNSSNPKESFTQLVNSISTLHKDSETKLVYVSDEDFTWIIKKDKDPLPIMIIAAPFSHTYIFNHIEFEGDEIDLNKIKEDILFCYIKK